MKDNLNIENARELIIEKINIVHRIIPHKVLSNSSKWHELELKIWQIGEEIRLIFSKNPNLRNDKN